jgi:transcriptional regulator with XRE-family HTH domain
MPVASSSTLSAFVDRLASAQVERGLSDFELISAVPTGRSHLLLLLSGRSSPLAMTLWKFGAALRVRPEWLAFGDGEPVPDPVEVVVPHPAVVRQAFAERLTFARERRGMTKAALAEAIGMCGTSNVSAFEAGRVGWKLHTLRQFSEALKVPGPWLMDVGEVRPWD